MDTFVVQPFTDYIYMDGSPYSEGQIRYVAKMLEPFRETTRGTIISSTSNKPHPDGHAPYSG